MDASQAKELQQSLLWTGVVEELDKKVAFATTKILTCTPEELPVLQATVLCYQALTRLPQDVVERET